MKKMRLILTVLLSATLLGGCAHPNRAAEIRIDSGEWPESLWCEAKGGIVFYENGALYYGKDGAAYSQEIYSPWYEWMEPISYNGVELMFYFKSSQISHGNGITEMLICSLSGGKIEILDFEGSMYEQGQLDYCGFYSELYPLGRVRDANGRTWEQYKADKIEEYREGLYSYFPG